MQIKDVEALLGIKIPDTQIETYEARLASAIAHINKECGNRFITGEIVTLPVDVQMGAALLVDEMGKYKANGQASRTLGDMSTSFFEGGAYRAAAKYWAAYRRARFH